MFNPSDIEDLTAKDIYSCLLSDIPRPKIEDKYPENNWSQIWKRLQNGVLSLESRSFLYLIIHERVGTKERGNRIMPGRYPSPHCPRCSDENIRSVENIIHRYTQCILVEEVWEWVRSQIVSLDISLDLSLDKDLLSLNFPLGLRENAVMWLLGIFVELVEVEVVRKGNNLKIDQVIGIYKQRKQRAKHQAIPELGLILALDDDAQGIG